jgi:2-dehydropantoate 2-reductase
MKMLVVGAGSVGGYFGGRLAAAGRDVTFLVRPGRALQLSEGLTILGSRDNTVVPVKLLVTGQASGGFDAILLAVKAYQLDGAIEDFSGHVGQSTLILPVLNGMRHMDALRGRFGATHVIGGVAKVATSLDADGRIQDLAGFHDLAYGEWHGEESGRLRALDGFLTGAGFDARLSREIEREMWEKWALLASLGAITCLMDGAIGQAARAPGGVDFASRLFAEVCAAIAAAWRPLSEQFLAQTLSFLTDKESAQTSSMYRDMKAGHRLEADQIIGDLVLRASAHAIATPLLSAALARLKVYEQSQSGRTGR